MSGYSFISGLVQVLGGILLCPLLPGLIQKVKAILQGRQGPDIFQPYRELRRLWGKSTVKVEGTTFIYQLAPSIACAVMVMAVLIVPISNQSPSWGIGHDAFLLVGVICLGRFVMASATWDTQNGFGLMGASRDVTIAVFAEAALVLSLTVAALESGTSNLRAIIESSAGGADWASPVLPLALMAFSLVALAEVGRQPIDNPDTHLELTMIHEGPLLEYAGRDLAYLQWNAAARHWVVLVLMVEVFLPHARTTLVQLIALPIELIILCIVMATIETVVVKMRVLVAPRLLGIGTLTALMAIVAWKMAL